MALSMAGGASKAEIKTAAEETVRTITSSRRLSLDRTEADNDERDLVEQAFRDANITSSKRQHHNAIPLENGEQKYRIVDQRKMLGKKSRQLIVDGALQTTEQDNEQFLKRFEQRIKDAGIKIPAVEVRFQDLTIDTRINVGARALPTNLNAFRNVIEDTLVQARLLKGAKRHFNILDHATGVLKPGRLTLLLGPPGGGKTSLLKALAGKLQMDSTVKIKGSVTYNGESFQNFIPQRTSAYIAQENISVPELTVTETLDFSARTQGTGLKNQMLEQLRAKEAESKVVPDPAIDAYLKATSIEGKRQNAVTQFIMRVLGLEVCADTPVGNDMIRGISGGQKKRVTTGEKLVGPCSTLFMDEISTGLDSSTTYLIVKCMRNFVHMTQGTVLMALLQPAPEVYDLFDDIMLLCEGQIVFHGPKDEVMPFFESLGFKLPERKGIADFLQEVTSEKDQAQYWSRLEAHDFVPVKSIATAFQETSVAKQNRADLEAPQIHAAKEGDLDPLQRNKYALGFMAQFKANLRREYTLIERHSFVYCFRFTQVAVLSVITGGFFWKNRLHQDTVSDGQTYTGLLFYAPLLALFDGFTEMAIAIDMLPIYFKQRDDCMYSGSAYLLPSVLLRLPYSLGQAIVISVVIYWMAGLAPDAGRFFSFLFLQMLTHQLSCTLFRLMGAIGRSLVVAYVIAWLLFLVVLLLGGFTLNLQYIHPWYTGAYWALPLQYLQNAFIINEFTAPRWQKPNPANPSVTLGSAILTNGGYRQSRDWVFWSFLITVGYLVLLTILTAVAFRFLQPLAGNKAPMPEDYLNERERRLLGNKNGSNGVSHSMRENPAAKNDVENGNGNSNEIHDDQENRVKNGDGHQNGDNLPQNIAVVFENPSFVAQSGHQNGASPKKVVSNVSKISRSSIESDKPTSRGSLEGFRKSRRSPHTSSILRNEIQKGMVLPFEPLSMAFRHIYYSVDLPSGFEASQGVKVDGISKPQLELLKDINGAFRPGVLTCLMGVSGAGKTTLMDVLCSRKTGGHVRGEIFLDGHPMEPTTFNRISGYVEQFDIHSPALTVKESFRHSAQCRLMNVDKVQLEEFVDEVLELMEMTALREAHVGTPGISGLSVEQRKRLTIGVELVANPSIIFLDEPTSGLDARAAAIVMRTVKNTVLTGRTVVCTIHQPSIDIFEAFDELVLLKRGGRMMYTGPTGHNSQKLVDYFQTIPGVEPIKEGINPASWMLEVSTVSAEERLGRDFADIYLESGLNKRMETMVEELSVPKQGSQPLHFDTPYSQSTWRQFLLLLKKFNIIWWRTPEYNATRIFFTIIFAFVVSSIYWHLGNKRSETNTLNNVIAALLVSTLFLGTSNASTIQPVVDVERGVFYRERGAGYYSSYPYAAAQFLIEVPYLFVQTILYSVITYFCIYFYIDAGKFFWYFFIMFLSLVYFTSYGIIAVAVSPNVQMAAVLSTSFYSLWFLAAGFVIPRPQMPGWLVWLYWINPVSYTIWGLVGAQLGDVQEIVTKSGTGETMTVAAYVEENYGIRHDFIGWIVLILFAYILVFLGVSAGALKKLNFQQK